jgi:hypothetical protein
VILRGHFFHKNYKKTHFGFTEKNVGFTELKPKLFRFERNVILKIIYNIKMSRCEDDEHKCDKCLKPFASKANLIQHLKLSKSCGSNPPLCTYCKKHFSSGTNLKNHLDICPKKKELDLELIHNREKDKIIVELRVEIKKFEIKIKEQDDHYDRLICTEVSSKEKLRSESRIKETMLKEQITKLEKTVEELHEKMTKLAATKSVSSVSNINSNNQNITLNMFITPEFVKNQTSEHLTYNHFADGIRGIAGFVHDFILMDNKGKLVYACYDKARHIFRYKDDNGNEIDDIDAEKLIAIVGKPIKEKFLSIYNQLEEDIARYQRIIDDEDEGYGNAKEKKAKAELSLKVMDLQSNDICTIGMSKNKKLSREVEKKCLVIK